jgi:hypothetical protein
MMSHVGTMKPLEFEDGDVQIDATIVAAGFGLAPMVFLERLREGAITSLCERGIDDDSGRYRLTFFSKTRRFRLVVDERGAIVQRSAIDFGDMPLPASARRPGG